MINTGNSLSGSSISVHRLTGNALRRWWQDPIITRNGDGYYNHGINMLLAELIGLPFLAILAYQRIGSPNIAATTIFVLFYLVSILLLISFFRGHCHHILEVHASESGLELKSPFLNRSIRWSDIADFFPGGTIEPKEFVLQCKNDEQFFLSKDLTDANKLFELIALRMSQPKVSYEINYYLIDGLFDACLVAAVAVILAIGISIVNAWVRPGNFAISNATDLMAMIFLALALSLSVIWLWLNLYKIPQLIRAGNLGLYLQSRSRSKIIPWDQIAQIHQIPGLLIVRSRLGWFCMFASKNEPLTEKLLEYKRNVLTPSITSL